MNACAELTEYDVTGKVVFDPDPRSPLEDFDNAWTLIADSRCPVDLETRAYTPHAGFRSDFRFDDEIRINREPRDTVALLRVDELGGGFFRIRRVKSLSDCNAIARISEDTIAAEWEDGREGAYRYLDGLLETLNDYYAGDVYGFVVTRRGEHIDSCWGYYGETDYVKDEMRESVQYAAEQARQSDLLAGLAPLTPYAPDLTAPLA